MERRIYYRTNLLRRLQWDSYTKNDVSVKLEKAGRRGDCSIEGPAIGEKNTKEHYKSFLKEKAGPWQVTIYERILYNADKKGSRVLCALPPESSA